MVTHMLQSPNYFYFYFNINVSKDAYDVALLLFIYQKNYINIKYRLNYKVVTMHSERN